MNFNKSIYRYLSVICVGLSSHEAFNLKVKYLLKSLK